MLICIPQTKGDENHRPGFDNWRSQLDRPGAQRTGCPEGARPRDGLSSGAASWTDDEPARRLPEGASKASQSPLTAIFKKELVRKYGLLYLNFLFLL
ncbi:hypothetical protein SALSENF001_28380 [Salmonella enterica subsp. enterica serovar Senftenberg]|nr:hypothetical protein [Salmonella enterica subsp. enterica]BBK18486.1 hypothetical protein SL180013_29860 [Salmonella enterica subsp. enterica serovar Senftenberg]